MSSLVRFGVSLEEKLLKRFDEFIKKKGYNNRSEAIRDLIRQKIVTEEWDEDKEVVGIIVLVYDHEKRELPDELIDFQHKYCYNIISSMHIHLDEHNCLETIIIRGKANTVKEIANQLMSIKGVKHGELIKTSTGKEL
jgi:CopG family nickel-responsive transcriptional regulator